MVETLVSAVVRRRWLVALCVSAHLAVATPVAAQPATDALPPAQLSLFKGIFQPPDLRACSARNRTPAQAGPAPRDPLRNGAIIGAVVGAVAFGGFAATLCHAYQEDGGASCLPDTVRFAAFGALIGTGAGLVIDVARSHRTFTVRVAVRY